MSAPNDVTIAFMLIGTAADLSVALSATITTARMIRSSRSRSV